MVGADVVAGLATWHESRAWRLVTLAVVARPGAPAATRPPGGGPSPWRSTPPMCPARSYGPGSGPANRWTTWSPRPSSVASSSGICTLRGDDGADDPRRSSRHRRTSGRARPGPGSRGRPCPRPHRFRRRRPAARPVPEVATHPGVGGHQRPGPIVGAGGLAPAGPCRRHVDDAGDDSWSGDGPAPVGPTVSGAGHDGLRVRWRCARPHPADRVGWPAAAPRAEPDPGTGRRGGAAWVPGATPGDRTVPDGAGAQPGGGPGRRRQIGCRHRGPGHGRPLGITDAFVVTSGRNARQVRTVVDEVERQVKVAARAGRRYGSRVWTTPMGADGLRRLPGARLPRRVPGATTTSSTCGPGRPGSPGGTRPRRPPPDPGRRRAPVGPGGRVRPGPR